jgi:TPP-dependent pyruvate/acetoin dehydrogenase alpha subunit
MKDKKKFDAKHIYSHMLRSRMFEEAVIELWQKGKISGEMHLSIGEEALTAGIVLQLEDGDALALDHRCTAAMLMRGVDPVLILKELLGSQSGLCKGRGGHMHLFSREHLAASSGIVGAAAPTAVGLALSAARLRPGKLALAFFGEGALNQGMVMESLNLAVVWKLPAIFVCKDDDWAITTLSRTVTAGDIDKRAASFNMPVWRIDGSDIEDVWKSAGEAVLHARQGKGPGFLHIRCVHPHGHYLGDPLLRTVNNPVREMSKLAGPLLKSVMKKKGGSISHRADSIRSVKTVLNESAKKQKFNKKDPLQLILKKFKTEKSELNELRMTVENEIQSIVNKATAEDPEKAEVLS